MVAYNGSIDDVRTRDTKEEWGPIRATKTREKRSSDDRGAERDTIVANNRIPLSNKRFSE